MHDKRGTHGQLLSYPWWYTTIQCSTRCALFISVQSYDTRPCTLARMGQDHIDLHSGYTCVTCAKFAKTPSVPLGPDANMNNYGLFPKLINNIILKFNYFTSTQVYWNWNLVQYCLPGH